ncbi:MAG TPA: hypothetical protein VGM37_07470 [Armatimonadota bacterium]
MLSGFLLGASVKWASPPSGKTSPNVVVLRSGKLVTLSGGPRTIKDLAAAIEEQTGRKVTLDEKYQRSPNRYVMLVRNVPVRRALEALAYLAEGRLERSGADYRLRPLSPAELANDTLRMEADVEAAAATLAGLQPGDPSLTRTQETDLNGLLEARRRTAARAWPMDNPDIWSINIRATGLDMAWNDGNGHGD